MRFGSLFSGIGGADLGLERAGMTCVFQCEIDPWCRGVLAKHWPHVQRFTDVKELSGTHVPPIDVLWASPPCQSASVAGQRKGQADERWLWGEAIRLVREIGPRWFLAENVPGLLTVDAGGGFGAVLRGLAEVGYSTEWTVLSAAQFGAPHLRERVWMVAYPERLRCHPVLWGAQGGQGDHPARHESEACGAAVCDPERQHVSAQDLHPIARPISTGGWSPEPGVGRVVDGFPLPVDRLRALGNAVVPQVVEWIGRRIMEVHRVPA